MYSLLKHHLMKSSQHPLRRFVSVFSLFACVWIGYFFADSFLFASANEQSNVAPDCVLSTTTCDFSNASATLANDTVEPLVPSTLSVNADSEASYLLVELEGVEMNMGIYKLKLVKTNKNQFQGDVMLPICMDAEMTWRGSISSPDKSISLPIDVRMVR
ncbi:hypothetical protein BCT27_10995 [Enterovibrio norvegicus]|nr:hypothetical protein BCT69_03740 [Enterovibrio norvegicus]PMN64475.1 hypothetical protein BCT27_10995 [Enterovibrio norvegicus]